MDLGVQRGASNIHEHITAHLLLSNLEGIEESDTLTLGLLKTVSEDTWVDSFAEESLSLAHELTNEEHIGGGTVTDDVILSSSSTSDHSSSGMLDLHLMKQDTSIFCELDLASSTDEPIFQKKRRVR